MITVGRWQWKWWTFYTSECYTYYLQNLNSCGWIYKLEKQNENNWCCYNFGQVNNDESLKRKGGAFDQLMRLILYSNTIKMTSGSSYVLSCSCSCQQSVRYHRCIGVQVANWNATMWHSGQINHPQLWQEHRFCSLLISLEITDLGLNLPLTKPPVFTYITKGPLREWLFIWDRLSRV